MRFLQKKLFIAVLSASNLAVLSLIFYVNFDNRQHLQLFFYSSSSNLEEQIKSECGEELEKLVNQKRNWFNCSITVKKRYYTLRPEVTVSRQDDGTINIEAVGTMTKKTQHATQAEFCNTCETKGKSLADENNLQDILKETIRLANNIYIDAEDAVDKAKRPYNENKRDKRIANVKERACKGKWDDDTSSFNEFSSIERLECHIDRIDQITPFDDRAKYYHTKLKKELWNLALTDEDYLLEDELLSSLKQPYKYPLSVQSSVSLLSRYLNWKDDFAAQDDLHGQSLFVKSIQNDINKMTRLMKPEQSRVDLHYLNKGFDSLLFQLDKSTSSTNTPLTIKVGPSINYDQVTSSTQHLYD